VDRAKGCIYAGLAAGFMLVGGSTEQYFRHGANRLGDGSFELETAERSTRLQTHSIKRRECCGNGVVGRGLRQQSASTLNR